MKYLLFYFFLCIITGIVLASGVFHSPAFYVLAGAACLILSLVFHKHFRIFFVLLMGASVALGGFAYSTSARQIHSEQWDKWIAVYRGHVVEIEGTVIRDLKYRTAADGSDGMSFILGDLKLMRLEGIKKDRAVSVPGKLKAFISNGRSPIAYGDRMRVRGTLRAPQSQRNPSGLDYKKYLMTRGCYALLFTKDHTHLGKARHPLGMVYSLKNRILHRMEEVLPQEAAVVTKAIFLGERSDLDPDFRTALANTGTLHLFAISGLHVGLIGGFLYFIFSLIGLSERLKSVLLMAALVFYAVLVGANPPVVRATIMACTFLTGRLFFQRSVPLNTLGFAGVVILLLNPEEVSDPGFQLSFFAVAGLILLTSRFFSVKDLRDSRSDSVFRRVRHYARSLLVVSTVAWIVTAPLVIHFFHRIHLLSPLINLVLIPVVFVLNGLLIVFSLLCLLPLPFVWLLKEPIAWIVGFLTQTVSWFEAWEIFTWTLAAWSPMTWMILAGGLFGLAFSKKIASRNFRWAASILLLLNCLLLDTSAARARLKSRSPFTPTLAP